MPRRPLVLAAASAALAGLALAGTGLAPSSAAPAPAPAKPVVLAQGLVTPLSLAVSGDGTRYVAQNFAGSLLRQQGKGKPEVVFQAKKRGQEVGAVSVRRGDVRFAVSGRNRAVLMGIGDSGKAVQLADLRAHELAKNPDGRVTYGFRFASKQCLAKVPEGIPGRYTGEAFSHPYATAQVAGGRTYVADAGGNAILTVPRPGVVRTVAVIPPTAVKITQAFAEANQMPQCVVGKSYWFESVPTDVEVGPDGALYVTSLPGGPEDGSLGANGAVYRVDPATRSVKKVVSGLVSPTGLAVSANRTIFVAELFRGQVSRALPGQKTAKPFARTALPADVEIAGGVLYATDQALDEENGGRLVRIKR
ncbi:ScyD/ScyE family protein [Nocardioides marinquilinus]|uniref:ScyD/ScyE family protein n=1 Tax=Nocardioides marinquilinus TaxID=1210400 RepID=A0ABP9PNM8_9ACTN